MKRTTRGGFRRLCMYTTSCGPSMAHLRSSGWTSAGTARLRPQRDALAKDNWSTLTVQDRQEDMGRMGRWATQVQRTRSRVGTPRRRIMITASPTSRWALAISHRSCGWGLRTLDWQRQNVVNIYSQIITPLETLWVASQGTSNRNRAKPLDAPSYPMPRYVIMLWPTAWASKRSSPAIDLIVSHCRHFFHRRPIVLACCSVGLHGTEGVGR